MKEKTSRLAEVLVLAPPTPYCMLMAYNCPLHHHTIPVKLVTTWGIANTIQGCSRHGQWHSAAHCNTCCECKDLESRNMSRHISEKNSHH